MLVPVLLGPVYIILKNIYWTAGFLLPAGRSNFLVVLHSTHGISQSWLRLYIIMVGFGFAFSDPSDTPVADISALSLDT